VRADDYKPIICIRPNLKEIMIVDSLWFYPIMGIVGLAIIYWFDKT